MPDHDEAVAAALDSYQYRLLPDHIHSHRADPTLAERLIDSFLQQLARYADRRDLDIHDTLAELHQQRIDRGGPDHAPEYTFRLGAQVQTRQQPAGDKAGHPLWRGFVTALAATPDGQAQCTVRIPGVDQALQVTAAELEPADSRCRCPPAPPGSSSTPPRPNGRSSTSPSGSNAPPATAWPPTNTHSPTSHN